ncbi:MAG: hypothetical protein ACK4IX_08585, partial [Candidatus Sericytochromatia bacterium]
MSDTGSAAASSSTGPSFESPPVRDYDEGDDDEEIEEGELDEIDIPEFETSESKIRKLMNNEQSLQYFVKNLETASKKLSENPSQQQVLDFFAAQTEIMAQLAENSPLKDVSHKELRSEFKSREAIVGLTKQNVSKHRILQSIGRKNRAIFPDTIEKILELGKPTQVQNRPRDDVRPIDPNNNPDISTIVPGNMLNFDIAVNNIKCNVFSKATYELCYRAFNKIVEFLKKYCLGDDIKELSWPPKPELVAACLINARVNEKMKYNSVNNMYKSGFVMFCELHGFELDNEYRQML